MAFHVTGSPTLPFFILVYLAITWYMLPGERGTRVNQGTVVCVEKESSTGLWVLAGSYQNE